MSHLIQRLYNRLTSFLELSSSELDDTQVNVLEINHKDNQINYYDNYQLQEDLLSQKQISSMNRISSLQKRLFYSSFLVFNINKEKDMSFESSLPIYNYNYV